MRRTIGYKRSLYSASVFKEKDYTNSDKIYTVQEQTLSKTRANLKQILTNANKSSLDSIDDFLFRESAIHFQHTFILPP